MIRASNQVSPKTKVVDLSFSYNFYFGQISSCYMKFGVSVNQNRVKILKFNHCSLQCLYCDARRPYRRLCSSAPLHASAIAPDLGVGALILANASKVPVPSRVPLFLPRSSERKRAELAVDVPLAELRRPRSISSRSELRNLAPKLLQSSTSSVEPLLWPNRAQTAVRRCRSPELRPARRTPSSGLPSRKTSPR